MKKIISAMLASLVLAGLVAIPLSTASAQAGLVSSLLTRMEKNRQSLKTLKANISMEKYNSQLREAEQFSGNVYYIPAGKSAALVRLEWNKPLQEILVVANGGYMLYRPRLKQLIYGPTNSVHSKTDNDVLGLLNMSAAQLR